MTERLFGSIYCDGCDCTFDYEAQVGWGAPNYEKFKCPQCGKELGELRADEGYQITSSSSGNQECRTRLDS